MKAKATVSLKLSKRLLQTVFDSLQPETSHQTSFRYKPAITKKGSQLIIDIEAQDTVALRASVNAYLRLINASLDSIETTAKHAEKT